MHEGPDKPGLQLQRNYSGLGRNHQITTCLSAARTMGWPGLQSNAWAKAGNWVSGPLVRNRAGACGSEAYCTFRDSGVSLLRQLNA